jgi:hypothetical protein
MSGRDRSCCSERTEGVLIVVNILGSLIHIWGVWDCYLDFELSWNIDACFASDVHRVPFLVQCLVEPSDGCVRFDKTL